MSINPKHAAVCVALLVVGYLVAKRMQPKPVQQTTPTNAADQGGWWNTVGGWN